LESRVEEREGPAEGGECPLQSRHRSTKSTKSGKSGIFPSKNSSPLKLKAYACSVFVKFKILLQKQSLLVRQLEEELRTRSIRGGASMELQRQLEALISENDHLVREIRILRETIKEMELRIESQKQTIHARDESIKKLLEMLQSGRLGSSNREEQIVREVQILAQKQVRIAFSNPNSFQGRLTIYRPTCTLEVNPNLSR